MTGVDVNAQAPQGLWDIEFTQTHNTSDVQPRPRHDHLHTNVHDGQIPVIDLSKLEIALNHDAAGDGDVCDEALQDLRAACESWGFFLLINHGIPQTLMSQMMEVASQFFELPTDVKMRFFDSKPDSDKTRYGVRLPGTSSLRDFLAHPWLNLSYKHTLDIWPDVPPCYRETAMEYSNNMHALSLRLLALLSKSLGLRESFLIDAFKDNMQKMVVNHYNPCPHITVGLNPHTDPNGITILQQDNVAGLEIFKDDCWHAVNPVRNAFVVNLGDALQIISNGRYRSVEHRVSLNSDKHRYSIGTFFAPTYEANIGPAAELIKQDGHAQYRDVWYGDYVKEFFAKGPKGTHYVSSLKIGKI